MAGPGNSSSFWFAGVGQHGQAETCTGTYTSTVFLLFRRDVYWIHLDSSTDSSTTVPVEATFTTTGRVIKYILFKSINEALLTVFP